MEPVNKSGKGRRGKHKKRTHSHRDQEKRNETQLGYFTAQYDEKYTGLSELHMACIQGQLATLRELVESGADSIYTSDHLGRRPLHLVLSTRSKPNTYGCLTYLLEQGADVNISTDLGTTPLHLAASQGYLDCTMTLVQAGGDVMARDDMGHSPLDTAVIWCHRKVARYLSSCVWQKDKSKEMQERNQTHVVYTDLVDEVKLNILLKRPIIDENVAEWANKKGLPLQKDFCPKVLVSQYHTQCLFTDLDSKNPKLNKPPPPLMLQPGEGNPQEDSDTTTNNTNKLPLPLSLSTFRPWTVFMGLQPERPPAVPDLNPSVAVLKDASSVAKRYLYYTTWDGKLTQAPEVSLDVLERVLFPRMFPSRIASPRYFEPQDIEGIQHRGPPAQGRSSSPWTEVAMHLVEVIEPGRY